MYRPAMSYYDAYNANLKFASYNGVRWSAQTVASKNSVGLYTHLLFDQDGAADILYYSKSADAVFRARSNAAGWDLVQAVESGGRWLTRAVNASGRQTMTFLADGVIDVLDLD